MCDLNILIEDLYEYLIDNRNFTGNIVRKHTKKLEFLGDISFPINPKNWYHLLDKRDFSNDLVTIFDYLSNEKDLVKQISNLITASQLWDLPIKSGLVKVNNVHLFLLRPKITENCIKFVLECGVKFGSNSTKLSKKYAIESDIDDSSVLHLSELRITILQKVITNLINFTCNCDDCDIIKIPLKFSKTENSILCGSVINDNGIKDTITTSNELYQKRKSDMQLMAQHKYGIQVKPSNSWSNYFDKIAKAAVTIEMLQNRPNKNTKILLNDTSMVNKNASFIFYNCARLEALFRQFHSKIANETYPELPGSDDIDFNLLNQPEEWELLFVYILQFPCVISGCISNVENGVVNTHYLVSFLASLSSTFSVYYRRVRILTEPREHLFPVLFARIYLLKAIQVVFHNVLRLLDIDPIKEM